MNATDECPGTGLRWAAIALAMIAAVVAACGGQPGEVRRSAPLPTPTSITEQWLSPLPTRAIRPEPTAAVAAAPGATPTPVSRYDGPVLVDGARRLVFTTTPHGTVALDADDFSIRATSPISGGMALDPEAGVVYIDQPGRGLHQLDAATLATRWFLPLTNPTPDPRWSSHEYYPFAASGVKPPLVDAANGRVFVLRGDGLLEIDVATRHVARRVSDLGTTTGIPIARAMLDPEAQLVYAVAVSPVQSAAVSWDLATFDLQRGRSLGSRPIVDGDVADLLAWDGNLVLGATPYRDLPALWRLSRGQETASVHAWPAADGHYVRDAGRHRILVQSGFQWPYLSTGSLFFVDDTTLELREWLSVPRDWQLRAIDPVTDRALFATDTGLVGRRMADLSAPTPLAALPTVAPAPTPFWPGAAVRRVAHGDDVFAVMAGVLGPRIGTCASGSAVSVTRRSTARRTLVRPGPSSWIPAACTIPRLSARWPMAGVAIGCCWGMCGAADHRPWTRAGGASRPLPRRTTAPRGRP